MEIVIGILSFIATAAKHTISPIKNHIKHLSNHENQVQTLKNQAESLKDRRERVRHSVDAANRNGEEIEHDVDNWLTKVDKKIAEEVEKVMQDEAKAKKKCFIGLCPNLWTRYKLNKKAEEEAKAVAELLEQAKFDRVSFRAAPQGIIAASVRGFEEFESRTLVLNGIMEALKDASINVIGVHGMGGIGKTTLVKEVARQVKEGKLFDSVVIATVTQTFDVKGIQDQIADLLGLRFEEQSMVGRALRLQERLKKEKKILVVLDDLWARLDLEEVGIPFGNEHEGCKILLTSRDLNVLSSGMDTQKNFAVGLLNEDEAWDLFKKMAGHCVESCDLQATAIEVAKKCAGLPIAIATVARALRNRSLFEWKSALCELKRPSSRDFKGVTAGVYSAIELSYNYLESEEVKLTFLLCSFLGHNGLIEDLLKYIIGLGLFHGVHTIEEARNRVLTVVSNLKASCLLLDSYNSERFDIHDVVWYVATSIANRDLRMFALINGDVLKQWPENEAMRNCSAINLLDPNISELPEEMECSLLSFFHMAHEGTVKIPVNFFRRTERLKVLDLTGMHFPSLPVSIELLTNLHTLCLNQCTLDDITIVGKLKNLEILSLAGSDIKALPQEIAQLTQLRMLDLSHCTRLKIIPPNVLSSLTKLEELYMDNSFVQWEDEVVGKERRNASLEELKHLSHLTTFYAHIPNAQIIPKHVFIEALDRYRILIGDEWEWSRNYEYSRTLKFKLYSSIYMDHGVKILMNKTEDLHLDQLKGIKNVLAELNNGEDFTHLKKLHIQNGRKVQYIATEKIKLSQLQSMTLEGLPQLITFCSQDKRCFTSQQQGNASSEPLPLFNIQFMLPHLESLQLSSINAKRIWHSQLSEACNGIPNLTSLIIEGCDNLEYLLSPSIARSLVQLKQFKIGECMCLRDIISTEGIEEEKEAVICFPRLDSLELKYLHNFIKFCSGNYNIEFPALKVLKIKHCPKLREFINESKMEGDYQSNRQALFNEKAAVPSLERMTISHLRNVKKILHNELLAGSFRKLEEMTVTNCDELLTVFSSTIIGVFSCLKKLTVSDCDSLQQIFEVGGLNIKEIHAVDCQPRELYISEVPKLKHVWNNDPRGILAFQNLRKVVITECPSLKNLFPASIAKDLPQLEFLEVTQCGVEEIVSAGEGLEKPIRFKFPQVSSLRLRYLNELKCFYPGQHTIVWPMLKKLETDYSTLLKIVASERLSIQEMNGNDQPESTIRRPLFLVEEATPKLEELRLRKIDDIAMVCDGQFPANFCHQIKDFALYDSRSGSPSFPINFFQIFYNLEILEFGFCDLKYLVSCEEGAVEKPDGGTILSRIRKLKLNYSKNVTHIWKKDSELAHILPNIETLEVQKCNDLISFGSSPSSASFKNLTTLQVQGCNMMINLVTPSVVQSLVQLTTMRIRRCNTMKEVVANEGSDGATYNEIIFFSKLKYLELYCLMSLASFCSGNYAFKFPCLEELIVNQCPRLKIFSQGVLSTPRLQRVKWSSYGHKGSWTGDLNITIQQLYSEKVGYHGIYDFKFSDTFPELMKIWNTNPQEILDFKNLRNVEFCNCSSLKYIFTLSMALSLKRLFHLKVKECSTMEEVIVEQGVEEEPTTDKLTIFPWLWKIEIESCLNLTSFYLGSRALEFPSLNGIRIADCPKMTTLSRDKQEGTTGDGNEKKLGQGNVYITATFFGHKIVSPKLERLDLSSINIQRIWHEQQLPSSLYIEKLEFLWVKSCHNLKYLFPSFMAKDFVQLKGLDIWDCKIMEEVIFIEGLTEEERMSQTLFPKLDFLSLKDLPELTRFCFESCFKFPCLRILRLTNCPLLKTFISKSVTGDEPQIHQNTEGSNLEVDNSALFNEKVVFPCLESLTVTGMRDCRKIWQDQLNMDSFCKLKNILVKDCETLLNIFPFSMMEKLEELDKLEIVNCNSLEEIIEPRGLIANESNAVTATESIVVEAVTKFVFPRVTYLRLDELPKLKSFYSRMHATDWPSLKRMKLVSCHKVELFASECLGFGETQAESQLGEISNKQPLFWVNEDTFPVLEELIWKRKDKMKGIWHGQLSLQCFRKLKVLNLKCFPDTSATALPYWFLRPLPYLEKIVINEASFCQIFQFEGISDEERHTSALTQIKELRLSKLPELTHLWKEEFNPRATLCKIRILEVLECGQLKTLVPSSVSFENLTTLEVSRCHGFINLIACSTAKSLMLLERMSITDCKMIEEIIACEGEEIKGGIMFTKLKYLRLSCLPSLASFCLGDHIFEFPALRRVILRECPKMKNFCEGVLSTPKLQQVQLTEDEVEVRVRWEGDLKTTVKELFKEMNVLNSEVTEVTLQLDKPE